LEAWGRKEGWNVLESQDPEEDKANTNLLCSNGVLPKKETLEDRAKSWTCRKRQPLVAASLITIYSSTTPINQTEKGLNKKVKSQPTLIKSSSQL